MSDTKQKISERKFGKSVWALFRVFRSEGSPYTELREVNGWRVDYPVRYHDGRVVYDRPENIPLAVRVWVSGQLDRFEEGDTRTKRFVLLDDGGKTADRYTLFDTRPFEGRIAYVAFNNRPYDPQGFGQHGEITVAQFNRHKAERFRALGKPIKLGAMSEDAQKFAKKFMDEALSEG